MTSSPLRFLRAATLSLLAVSAATVTCSSVARADEIPITPEAREHFVAGVRMLKDPAGPRYEEAYQEFRVAYASSPSPRILGNMGLCAMKLERDEEAIGAYEKYLAGVADLDPGERQQIEGDLTVLKASLVRLTLLVDTDGARVVDARTPVQGAPITNVYGPFPARQIQLGVHPGHHTITVKREGFEPSGWDVDALPAAQLSHGYAMRALAPVAPVGPVAPAPLLLPQPEVVERPTPTSVYVLTTLTGAFLVGGVITGAAALQKKRDFDAANDGTMPTQARSIKSSGQKLNVVTDVLVGSAIVSAGVAAGLYFSRPTIKVAPGARPTSASSSIRLRIGPSPAGPAGAMLEGAF